LVSCSFSVNALLWRLSFPLVFVFFPSILDPDKKTSSFLLFPPPSFSPLTPPNPNYDEPNTMGVFLSMLEGKPVLPSRFVDFFFIVRVVSDSRAFQENSFFFLAPPLFFFPPPTPFSLLAQRGDPLFLPAFLIRFLGLPPLSPTPYQRNNPVSLSLWSCGCQPSMLPRFLNATWLAGTNLRILFCYPPPPPNFACLVIPGVSFLLDWVPTVPGLFLPSLSR